MAANYYKFHFRPSTFAEDRDIMLRGGAASITDMFGRAKERGGSFVVRGILFLAAI